VVALGAVSFSGLQAQEAATRTSALDGAYTVEQAERGQETFQRRCNECHETGEFTARSFLLAWNGQAVYYLFKDITTLMPEDNPGSLRSRDVVDVLAYMMKLNGLPAGEEELPDDQEALRGIVWAIPSGGGS
jgi:mono/diheme cytochrome c family protein